MLAAGGRVRRALAMTIATIGALGSLTLAPTMATAADASDDAEPAVAAVDPVVAVGDDLVVQVSIGEQADEELDVAVLVGSRPVATRSALSAWLDDGIGPSLAQVATATIAEGSSSVDVTVPAASLPWAGGTSGAMLLAASVEGVDERMRSLVTLDLSTGGPTRIALAMPTTTPATDSGLLTAEQLVDALADDGALSQQLAIGEAGAALGIDPIVPASIAALGDDAPDEAVAWMQSVASLPQTYALPYAGADPIAVARSGAAVPPLAGIPSPDGALLPSSLAQVPTTMAPVVDATDASLSPALLGSLAASSTVIVGTDALDERLERQTPSAHVAVGGASVLAADAELQRLVGDAVTAAGTASTDGIARIMGLLATVTREAPSVQRTLVAALPRTADPDAVLALQEAIASAGWLESSSIAAALSTPARDAELVASEPSQQETDAADRVAALVAADAEAEAVTSTLVDPTALVAPVRLQLLAAIAAATTGDADAVARFGELVAPLRTPVTIVEGGDTAVLSATAELQVTVENRLDADVTVQLVARTGTNAVTVPREPIEVAVAAGSRVRVPVPVEVVAAGSGIIRFEVRTPDGVLLDDAALRINAVPSFETVLLVIVGAAAALLLGFGILRSVRNRRAGTARGDMDPRTEQLAVADARDAAAERRAAERDAHSGDDDRPGATA